jgi:hypothetical protein
MRQIASRLEQEFRFPVSFSMVQRTLQQYADHNLPLANLGRAKAEKGRKTKFGTLVLTLAALASRVSSQVGRRLLYGP